MRIINGFGWIEIFILLETFVLSARVSCCGVQEAIALLVNILMPDDSFAENEFTKMANLYNGNIYQYKQVWRADRQ